MLRRGGAPATGVVEAFAVDLPVPGEAWWMFPPDAWHASIDPADLDARPAATARAGDDGAFALTVAAPGSYCLAATGADGAFVARWAFLRAAGVRTEADVDLPLRPSVLRGRLSLRDGSPFLGRVAFLRHPEGAIEGLPDASFPGAQRAVAVDAVGRFAIGGLAVGRGLLAAVGLDGTCVVLAPIDLPSAEALDGVVDGGAQVEVTGRVLDGHDGTPLAGAAVTAEGFDDERRGIAARLVSRVVTGADGTFRLRSFAAGCRIGVRCAGHVPAAQDVASPAAPVEIRLRGLGRVSGRVRAPDGRPLAGVPVWWNLPYVRAGARVETDAEGRFEIADVVPGTGALVAFGAGWVSRGVADAAWAGYDPTAVEIRPGAHVVRDREVVPAVAIRGVVVDEEGAPIAGALVEARATRMTLTRGPNPGDRHLPTGVHPRWWRDEPRSFVASARDGSFTLFVPHPSRDRLAVSAPGRCEGDVGPLDLDTPTPSPVRVVLGPARVVEVAVLDAHTGEPVRDAKVGVFGPESEPFDPYGALAVARVEEGRGTLRGVPARAYWIAAWARGCFLSDEERWLSFGGAVRLAKTLTIRRAKDSGRDPSWRSGADAFPRGGPIAWAPGDAHTRRAPPDGESDPDDRTIRGLVVDERGRGIEGVRLETVEGRPQDVCTAYSGEDGRFEIRGLVAEDHRVAVRGPPDRIRVRPVAVPAGTTDVRIVLLPGVAPVLTILDRTTGAPVARITVQVGEREGDDVRAIEVVTDRRGRARIEGLDPSRTYVLRVGGVTDAAWRPAAGEIRVATR